MLEILVGLGIGLTVLFYVGEFFNWLFDEVDIQWQYTWRPWLQANRGELWWALVGGVSALGLVRLLLEVI